MGLTQLKSDQNGFLLLWLITLKKWEILKTYKNIIISTDNHLGLLTLNRLEENNSLNIEASKEIYEGLKELEMNSSIRVILIQGNEKKFSPGADIKELNNLSEESAKSKGLFNFFDKIKEINIPIVAAVEGYALGGGMELALLCDIIMHLKNLNLVNLKLTWD